MTVTVEQHRAMAKAGITQRKDGLFGFKKRCIRAGCVAIVEGTCYATDTLAEALVAVTERSSYHHDEECWFGDEAWWDGYDEEVMDTVADGPLWGRVQEVLGGEVRNGVWLRDLRGRDRELYRLVQRAFTETLDFWDPDDAEVGCEV